jgi:hypothetical protein
MAETGGGREAGAESHPRMEHVEQLKRPAEAACVSTQASWALLSPTRSRGWASDVLSGEDVAVLKHVRALSDQSFNLDGHQLLRTWACSRSVSDDLKARLRRGRHGCQLGNLFTFPWSATRRSAKRLTPRGGPRYQEVVGVSSRNRRRAFRCCSRTRAERPHANVCTTLTTTCPECNDRAAIGVLCRPRYPLASPPQVVGA